MGGKKGKPKIELDSALVRRLAGLQCTYEEIASALGVSVDTLDRRREDTPEIAEAIKEGRSLGKRSLRRMQLKSAKGGSVTMQIWLGKQWLDQKDRQDIEHHEDKEAIRLLAALDGVSLEQLEAVANGEHEQ